MNEVKKAMAISSADKELAIMLYKASVTKIANKFFVRQEDDAHVELSVIFGQQWMFIKGEGFGIKNIMQANNAFNYANIHLGMRGEFKKTATELVSAEKLVDSEKLATMTEEMSALLTVV